MILKSECKRTLSIQFFFKHTKVQVELKKEKRPGYMYIRVKIDTSTCIPKTLKSYMWYSPNYGISTCSSQPQTGKFH